jgi:hypothetical protein
MTQPLDARTCPKCKRPKSPTAVAGKCYHCSTGKSIRLDAVTRVEQPVSVIRLQDRLRMRAKQDSAERLPAT